MQETPTGYRALFRTAHVPSLACAMVLARIPVGVVTIVLVVFISSYYGAAVAGFCTAAFTAGMAAFAPIFGRMVDKGHGPATLRILALAELASIVALVVWVWAGAAAWIVIACAFACGSLFPPVAGVTRSLWPNILEMSLVSTAYNFEVLVIDALYVTGPLLASVFVALGASEWGLIFTTIIATVGAFILASLTPVKDQAVRNLDRTHARKAEAHKNVAKPALLTLPIVLVLMTCLMKFAYSGWLETLIPLFYADQSLAALGSVAISAWSVGAVAGVVLFNRFQPSTRRISAAKQLAASMVVFFAFSVVTPVALGSFAAVCVIMFFIGAAGAPGDNLYYQISGRLAPEERQAEMFSWLNTATSVGLSAGAFMAGVVVEGAGYQTSFVLPSACIAVAFLFAAALVAVSRKHQVH